MNKGESIIHSRWKSGHRREYLSLFAKMFSLRISIGKVLMPRCCVRLIKARRLLFSSLDDDFIGFVLISLLRVIVQKKTVGILVRPKSVISKTFIGLMKRTLLLVCCRNRWTSVITIVPHDYINGISLYSNGWIYDPQMWDLLDSTKCINQNQNIQQVVVPILSKRRMLLFVGRVSLEKGIQIMWNQVESCPEICEHTLIVIAGKVDDDCEEYVGQLMKLGVLVINRYITNGELYSLYNLSSFVWCCYDKIYDQSSGVFGRTLQFGKCAIIRKGAQIAKYKQTVNDSIVELSPENSCSLNLILSNIPLSQSRGTFAARAYEWKDACEELLCSKL